MTNPSAPESPVKEQPEVAMPDVRLTREWVESERRYWLNEAAGSILPYGFLLRVALCASWLNSKEPAVAAPDVASMAMVPRALLLSIQTKISDVGIQLAIHNALSEASKDAEGRKGD